MKEKLIGLLILIGISGMCLTGCSKENAPFRAAAVTNTYMITEGFENISVASSIVDINLNTTDESSCEVICEESSTVNFSVEVYNNELLIKQHSDFLSSWFFCNKPLRVTINLPKTDYKSLSVSTGSGNIIVPYDMKFEDVSIATSSGDVKFAAAVEKNTLITASSGVIILTDSHLGNLNATASSGDVSLINTLADGNLDIVTSSGDVLFDGADADNISVVTSSGDVMGSILSGKQFMTNTSSGNICVPQSEGSGNFVVKTSSGNVTIKYVEE